MSDTALWTHGLIIIALLALSGLFSSSETALTAISKARLHILAKEGNKRAQTVLKLIEDKEKLIGAILLGNNLVNILASALATRVLMIISGEKGVVFATLAMTALILIFSEVLPKSYAIAKTEKTALFLAPLIQLLVSGFSPVVSLVQHIVRITLKIFGVDITAHEHILSSHEEIRGHIELHSEEGRLKRADQVMLGSILDLRDVTVRDVMVHRGSMQALNANAGVNEIVTQVVRSPYTRLPIYDGAPDNIIGILHAKDVLRAIKRAGGQIQRFNIRRAMTAPWFVPETTSLGEQLSAFLDRKNHFALVVDEYGDLQGLVTLEDILEEIVGDIADEHDYEAEGIRPESGGSFLIDGTTTIRELNRVCHFSLPEDDATTIAGLVIHEAETIPIVGQKFDFFGYGFEITARRRNQLTQIRVKPPKKPTSGKTAASKKGLDKKNSEKLAAEKLAGEKIAAKIK